MQGFGSKDLEAGGRCRDFGGRGFGQGIRSRDLEAEV